MIASRPSARRTSIGCVAVTGSKGGVGKSNLVVNLAVSLGRSGRRVLVIDGDLGLANLDVLLGLAPPRNVQHLVHGDVPLDELLIDGPGGIRILPAASGVPELTRLDPSSRSRLLAALAESSSLADDILIDTGAGIGETTLSLQLAASRVVVVTTTEPTSLVDAYASIKVLWDADPRKPVDLVVNNVVDEEEAATAYGQISRACGHFLDQQPGWLGAVYADPRIPGAVKRQRALLELYPSSPAARCYERIALQLAARRSPVVDGPCWDRLAEVAREEVSH